MNGDAHELPTVQIAMLETLLAIRDYKSAKAVALKFKINVSGISRRIKDLEAAVGGVPLVKRRPHGFDLTDAGVSYAKTASRILAELEHARAKLQSVDAEPKGHVKVHMSEVLLDEHFMPVIRELTDRYSRLAVDIVIGSAETARTALLNRNTDFATIYGLKTHGDIEVVVQADYPLVAVVRTGHPLGEEYDTISLSDLFSSGNRLALPPRPYATRMLFESLVVKHTPLVRLDDHIVAEINSFDHLKTYALGSTAIAIVPLLSAHSYIKDGRLKAIHLVGANAFTRGFALCRHRRHALSPAATVLFDTFRKKLAVLATETQTS